MDSGSKPPLLSGPIPGLVDPSQRSRLLRTPTSSLFFAVFDPLTARSTFPNLSNLHIDTERASRRANPEVSASSNGKRIVIEIDPENGSCSWRFVPRAKFEGGESFGDEGSWPRVVELCGRLVCMTQDQWDLHKLDPEYDCIIHKAPSLSIIARKTAPANTSETAIPESPATPKTRPVPTVNTTPTPKATRKHSPSPTIQDPLTPRKRRCLPPRVRPSRSSGSDRMIVDGESLNMPNSFTYKPGAQDTNEKKRRRVSVQLGETSASEGEKLKKNLFGSNDHDILPTPAKRVRSRSPGTVRREMEHKRLERERKRKADIEARLKVRRAAHDRAFWESMGVPPPSRHQEFYAQSSEPETDEGAATPSDTADEDEEFQRLSNIEESRRKLAELEKDKPLWEESAKIRQAREREDEQMRQRAKAMKAEEERQRQRAEELKRQREERWEQDRREHEREVRKREQSGRMFVHGPPGIYRWTVQHALDRYLQTAAEFDAAKFSAMTRPLVFASIPWPVLHFSFSIQEIEWDAVETFFARVEMLVSTKDFKDLVEKSQRRFHPDRWRSRGLLVSVKDEMQRDLLEVAGSTVAQALTPLWKQVSGRG